MTETTIIAIIIVQIIFTAAMFIAADRAKKIGGLLVIITIIETVSLCLVMSAW